MAVATEMVAMLTVMAAIVRILSSLIIGSLRGSYLERWSSIWEFTG